MKVTKTLEVPLDLTKVKVIRNVRSDLARRVEEDWVKFGPKRWLGNQYLTLKEDGTVTGHDWISRQDVLMYQLWDGFNAFVQPDGSVQIEAWEKVTVSDEEFKVIRAFIDAQLADIELQGYVNHERIFLETQPWMQCEGMTPAQAIAHLKALGWY